MGGKKDTKKNPQLGWGYDTNKFKYQKYTGSLSTIYTANVQYLYPGYRSLLLSGMKKHIHRIKWEHLPLK